MWLKQIGKWALTPIDKPQAFVNKRYKNAWKSVWWDIEWVVVIVGFVLCILYVRGKNSCFVSIKKETHTRILSLLERINLSRAVNYFSFPFLVSKNRFVSTKCKKVRQYHLLSVNHVNGVLSQVKYNYINSFNLILSIRVHRKIL